jgi:predicted Zn-dependent protease
METDGDCADLFAIHPSIDERIDALVRIAKDVGFEHVGHHARTAFAPLDADDAPAMR